MKSLVLLVSLMSTFAFADESSAPSAPSASSPSAGPESEKCPEFPGKYRCDFSTAKIASLKRNAVLDFEIARTLKSDYLADYWVYTFRAMPAGKTNILATNELSTNGEINSQLRKYYCEDNAIVTEYQDSPNKGTRSFQRLNGRGHLEISGHDRKPYLTCYRIREQHINR